MFDIQLKTYMRENLRNWSSSGHWSLSAKSSWTLVSRYSWISRRPTIVSTLVLSVEDLNRSLWTSSRSSMISVNVSYSSDLNKMKLYFCGQTQKIGKNHLKASAIYLQSSAAVNFWLIDPILQMSSFMFWSISIMAVLVSINSSRPTCIVVLTNNHIGFLLNFVLNQLNLGDILLDILPDINLFFSTSCDRLAKALVFQNLSWLAIVFLNNLQ